MERCTRGAEVVAKVLLDRVPILLSPLRREKPTPMTPNCKLPLMEKPAAPGDEFPTPYGKTDRAVLWDRADPPFDGDSPEDTTGGSELDSQGDCGEEPAGEFANNPAAPPDAELAFSALGDSTDSRAQGPAPDAGRGNRAHAPLRPLPKRFIW